MIFTINLSISTLEQRCFKVFYDNYYHESCMNHAYLFSITLFQVSLNVSIIGQD